MFSGAATGGDCARRADRGVADQGRDAAAILHVHRIQVGCGRDAVASRHLHVAVDGDRGAVLRPDRQVGAASQRGDAWLGCRGDQDRGYGRVDGVAALVCNLAGSRNRAVRTGGQSKARLVLVGPGSVSFMLVFHRPGEFVRLSISPGFQGASALA